MCVGPTGWVVWGLALDTSETFHLMHLLVQLSPLLGCLLQAQLNRSNIRHCAVWMLKLKLDPYKGDKTPDVGVRQSRGRTETHPLSLNETNVWDYTTKTF